MKKLKQFIKSNERVVKTFVEAFCSYIAINIATTDFSSDTALKGLLMGAVASAISFVINYRKEN